MCFWCHSQSLKAHSRMKKVINSFLYVLIEMKICVINKKKTNDFCFNCSENGECCFVGSAEGVSVIGWEPDREFDHIESAWSMLGDMKVVKQKLVRVLSE